MPKFRILTAADIEALPMRNRELAKSLKTIMLDRGLSQTEMASRTGLTKDNISRYQIGSSFPQPKQLEKLARGLRVTVADLVPCMFNGEYEKEITLARNTTTGRDDSVLREHIPLSIQESDEHPGKAYLRVGRLVPMEVALTVMKLIRDAEEAEKNDAADRAASR